MTPVEAPIEEMHAVIAKWGDFAASMGANNVPTIELGDAFPDQVGAAGVHTAVMTVNGRLVARIVTHASTVAVAAAKYQAMDQQNASKLRLGDGHGHTYTT